MKTVHSITPAQNSIAWLLGFGSNNFARTNYLKMKKEKKILLRVQGFLGMHVLIWIIHYFMSVVAL